MISALTKAGLHEDKVAKTLNNIMEYAYTCTPEGKEIPDFKSMLRAIEVWYKMMKKGPDTVINIPLIFGNMQGGI